MESGESLKVFQQYMARTLIILLACLHQHLPLIAEFFFLINLEIFRAVRIQPVQQ